MLLYIDSEIKFVGLEMSRMACLQQQQYYSVAGRKLSRVEFTAVAVE